MNKRYQLLCAGLAAGMLGVSAAQAQEEDSSAAFQADNEVLGAALGLPAAESTVTTHANGMTSATVGLSAMKMLVVRKNSDGTLSVGHVSSQEEARAFVKSGHSHGPAEE